MKKSEKSKEQKTPKKPKTNKKSQISLKQGTRNPTTNHTSPPTHLPTSIITIIALIRLTYTSQQTYGVNLNKTPADLTLDCSSSTTTYLYAMRLKKYSNQLVSFQLSSQTAFQDYFPDSGGVSNHEYSSFTPGGSCFYHQEAARGGLYPMFILVIGASGASPPDCKVHRIITNQVIEPCATSPAPATLIDIFQVFELKTLGGGAGTVGGFRRVVKDQNFAHESFLPVYGTFWGMPSSGNIDPRTVELTVLRSLHSSNVEPVAMIDYSLAELNEFLQFNTFATKVNYGQVMARIIRDDLPGYYLDPNLGHETDSSRSLERFCYLARDVSTGTHTELYIPNYFKYNTGGATPKRRTFIFTIEIKRASNQLEFRVRDDQGAPIPDLDINHAYSGGSNYIYFTFTYGGAIRSFEVGEATRSVYFRTLHVFEVGKPVSRTFSRREADTPRSDTQPYKSDYTSVSWMKVELIAPSGVSQNLPGFRVLSLDRTDGIYPPFLITTAMNMPEYPRCYFDGFWKGTCFGMAILKDSGEVEAGSFLGPQNAVFLMSGDPGMKERCRVGFNQGQCMSPKPGFVVNLDVTRQLPLRNNGALSAAEYAGLDPELKVLVQEFVSNTGAKYYASCHSSCKKVKKFHFLQIFQIFGIFQFFKDFFVAFQFF